jgi:hypothetical protein
MYAYALPSPEKRGALVPVIPAPVTAPKVFHDSIFPLTGFTL